MREPSEHKHYKTNPLITSAFKFRLQISVFNNGFRFRLKLHTIDMKCCIATLPNLGATVTTKSSVAALEPQSTA